MDIVISREEMKEVIKVFLTDRLKHNNPKPDVTAIYFSSNDETVTAELADVI